MIPTRTLLLAIVLALACCVLSAQAGLASRHAASRRGTHDRSALRAAAARREAAPMKSKGKKRKVLRRAGSCKPRTTSAATTLSAEITVSETSPVSASTTEVAVTSASASSSSTALASSSTTLVTQVAPALSGATSQIASTQSSSSTAVTPSASSSSSTSATPSQQVTTASTTASSTSSSAPASTSAVSVDTDGDGPFSGEFTWYALGTDGSSYGACGTSLVDSDKVAAVSMLLFDSWPGYDGTNPNNNPICGHSAKVTYGSKSVVVRIEDRCVGCAERNLDLSESAFQELADLGVGRADMTWEWVS